MSWVLTLISFNGEPYCQKRAYTGKLVTRDNCALTVVNPAPKLDLSGGESEE